MSALTTRRWLRRSRRGLALVAVLIALAGVDLVHHAIDADGHSHGEDICFAIVAGVGLAAVTVIAAVSTLPRPSYQVALGSISIWAAPPPRTTARAGPPATVVLRL
jgi:hypothetical protein